MVFANFRPSLTLDKSCGTLVCVAVAQIAAGRLEETNEVGWKRL